MCGGCIAAHWCSGKRGWFQQMTLFKLYKLIQHRVSEAAETMGAEEDAMTPVFL